MGKVVDETRVRGINSPYWKPPFGDGTLSATTPRCRLFLVVACDITLPWTLTWAWRRHSVLRCFPSVATLLRTARTQTKSVSEDFQKCFFVSRTQNLCPPQRSREWQNESTFGKQDKVSNVAATIGRFIRGKIKSAAYLSRDLSHLYEHGLYKKLVRGLRKPRTCFLCR